MAIAGFADAFALTCGLEGSDLSLDPSDPGNWTGGKVGAGKLVGSRWGISAAAFPTADIPGLTYEQAQALAKQHYWDPFSCDQLPPVIGWLVFDAAYNGGHPAQWLQAALGVTVDGQIGAGTVASARAANLGVIALRFLADREDYWASLPAWDSQGRGWIHRGTSIMRTVSDNIGGA